MSCLSETDIRNAVQDVLANEKNVELVESTDTFIEYYDTEGDYSRIYYFPEKIDRQHIRNILMYDKEVAEHINIESLIDFLLAEIDKNALSACQYILLQWEDDDGYSKAAQEFYNRTDDEYAVCALENIIGLTWVERQSVLINVRKILEVSDEFEDELSYEDFKLGFLSSLFHEFRHLLYECHELIKIGTDEYLQDGGIEEYVEEYGNTNAERTLRKYEKMFI